MIDERRSLTILRRSINLFFYFCLLFGFLSGMDQALQAVAGGEKRGASLGFVVLPPLRMEELSLQVRLFLSNMVLRRH
jgi:hypothetical protein